MKTLILSTLLLLFSSPQPQHVFSPAPPNPYCGKTAGDFPQSTIECPDPGEHGEYYVINVQCALDCGTAYQNIMVSIYDEACVDYNDATNDFDNEMEDILDAYTDCYAAASTQIEKQICKDNARQSTLNALNVLTTQLDSIQNFVSSNTQIITDSYFYCASMCCEKVIEKH